MEEEYSEQSQDTSEQTVDTQTQDSNNVTMSREELQQLLAPMQEYSQEKAVTAATTDISSRIADFDLSKVHDALKEMHKTDPSKAESMNNPQGWELLWMRELASKSVNTDAVNSGRNVDSEGGRGALISKIREGNGSIDDRASLMEKYL